MKLSELLEAWYQNRTQPRMCVRPRVVGHVMVGELSESARELDDELARINAAIDELVDRVGKKEL